ncbi:lysophospholipid acyltransferase family protein [Isoalcanivorax indicus]|uniref:lysophospholipid acyltransferase family protein n=1 Tax=Isoalcanivorax indicus TaxID=2202653 RepID=UPI001FE9EAD7|nr:lysophospholipid acyltransferase family protein [Isoalcanivorax indicus]
MQESTMDDIRPFSPATARRIMTLGRLYFRPTFVGLEQLDLGKPALFVGNHTLYGMLDLPLMVQHLYTRHGLLPRALGDRSHFMLPLWRDLLRRNGMVLGTPANCDALMDAGESILVFPGGAREVWRRKGEQYQLIWKKRLGFVRQAIKHGYDIIPFGSLGPDECYTILADANDVTDNPTLRWLLEQTGLLGSLRGGDMIPPLSRGMGPTLLPRPQRFYFGFGERIPTRHLAGLQGDEQTLWDIRHQVAAAVEQQIVDLKAFRQGDRRRNWSWLRRHLAPVTEQP